MGHPWSTVLDEEMRRAKRVVTRGIGPPARALVVDPEILAKKLESQDIVEEGDDQPVKLLHAIV
eukprot:5090910-Amphidinium_carterae.1